MSQAEISLAVDNISKITTMYMSRQIPLELAESLTKTVQDTLKAHFLKDYPNKAAEEKEEEEE